MQFVVELIFEPLPCYFVHMMMIMLDSILSLLVINALQLCFTSKLSEAHRPTDCPVGWSKKDMQRSNTPRLTEMTHISLTEDSRHQSNVLDA